MALSTTSRRGLALTALLPVLLSVYSEYRKDAELQAQQQQARLDLQRQRREAEQARDLDNAQKLLGWIAADVAERDAQRRDAGFCNHLFMASELVRATTTSTATRQALASALDYRPETEDPTAKPMICDCPNTLELMRTSWAPARRSAAPLPVVAEMTDLLGRTAALCAPEPQVVVAAAPLPEPPPEVLGAPAPVGEAPPAAGSGAHRGEPHPPPPPPTPEPRREPPREAAPTPSLPAGACDEAAARGRLQGPAPDAAADARAVTVYLQIAVEAQRATAQNLQRQLRAAGYAVPGIERVGAERAPERGELRYFSAADDVNAVRLSADLQAACGDAPLFAGPPRLIASLRGRALPKTFEIWFATPAAGAAP